jgi:hypothetical protein
MLDPQFLSNIRTYLNDQGNSALDSGIRSIVSQGGAAQASPQSQPLPTAKKSDALSSGIQSGIQAVSSNSKPETVDNSKYMSAIKEWMPVPTKMNAPPAGYRPGFDPEFNYGIGNPQSATAIRNYNMSLPENIKAMADAAAAAKEAEKKKDEDKKSKKHGRDRSYASSFTINSGGGQKGPSGRSQEDGYGSTSGGGLASLIKQIASGLGGGISKIGSGISNLGSSLKFADGGQIDPASMMEPQAPTQDREVLLDGIAALGPQIQTPQSPTELNEKELISQAISAIKGEIADPRRVLAVFVSKYGEDALRDLVDKVESGDVDATAEQSQGQMKGPGDGMSDMIPASAEGSADVLLSDGEYVVPADVVSGLGNGSSDAGAKRLDEMMSRVRQQRTGSKAQAKEINAKEAMPA